MTFPVLGEAGYRVWGIWKLLLDDELLIVISDCLAQPKVMLVAGWGIFIQRSKCPICYRVGMTRKRAVHRMKQKRAATHEHQHQHRRQNAECEPSEPHDAVWSNVKLTDRRPSETSELSADVRRGGSVQRLDRQL